MKIRIEKPPIWDEAKKVFDFREDTTVFSYGNILYNPGNVRISDDLMVHEETHARQQGYSEAGAKEWWDKYLVDPKFLADQEIEAYAAQYKFICEKVKDRNNRARILSKMAYYLSGRMYGKPIIYQDALKRIREKSGV